MKKFMNVNAVCRVGSLIMETELDLNALFFLPGIECGKLFNLFCIADVGVRMRECLFVRVTSVHIVSL